MPRPYQFHTTATLRYLQVHWPRQPLTEIAATLGIPVRKLSGLAHRHGLRKRELVRAIQPPG
ncbi:hypothetical protein [Hymenobacter arizonensis]|uniref:Uncharacterized protein n=1 Tax=Hymenobacter arizonensis TaxID=1227077 RepID=A0A1I5TA19_HYMAR|nr:hypothetical protein [Hymenobacter arizonensis]SFP79276.1 hypothetical protein SAMN04515668_0361 [Hymenobacter arizonensis]